MILFFVSICIRVVRSRRFKETHSIASFPPPGGGSLGDLLHSPAKLPMCARRYVWCGQKAHNTSEDVAYTCRVCHNAQRDIFIHTPRPNEFLSFVKHIFQCTRNCVFKKKDIYFAICIFFFEKRRPRISRMHNGCGAPSEIQKKNSPPSSMQRS